MADSTNTISIAVIDGVAPEIAPKLIAIADASDKAAASVGTLADQIATLKGAGLGSISTMLDKLEANTLKVATAQTTLTKQMQATTNAAYQQAGALGETTAALGATSAASKAAATAGKEKAASDVAGAGAAKGLVSANISAAAGLGILEGRTLSMNRAAANFVTRILGLGPILQQAFVVIGAVALLAVIYQMVEGLVKVVKSAMDAGHAIAMAFDGIINPLRKTNDELQLTNDKLDSTIAKLEHRPTTNGAAMAIDEARVMADKLDDSLERVSKDLDSILKKNEIGFFGGMLTGQATTGDTSKYIQTQWDKIQAAQDNAKTALDNAASIKDPKAAEAALTQAYQSERTAIQSATQAIIDKYNATKKLQDTQKSVTIQTPYGPQTTTPLDQTANLTELGKAGHLAQQELRNLDLTMDNLQKNKLADHLRDAASGVSAATKQAAKDWKALEAAFVSFQTTAEKAGHKPTDQENLTWLQNAKNNPANADKLQAKELPYQTKITGDQDWVKEQSSRLQNQVNEIGLYDDALKEASMLKTILQEADQKSIKLTDQQTDSLKQQIATIVESKDYQKQLEDVYKSVNEAKDLYAAKTKALSTALKDGVLTQAQYDQALTRTTRDYNEASNAVTAFQRKLSDQQRDSANKLGSNRDIAANTELQGLAEQMRKGDATHPGGYTQAQITAQLDAMREQVKTQQSKNEIDQATNKLIFEQTNLYDQLIVREKALNAAVQAGTMSQQAANAAKLQDWNQQNDMQLKSGTGGNPMTGALADYAKQFTTVNAGLKDAFSATFKTLADGFADTIGKAIVGAKNLGAALKEVAKSAISELISALIKLAIEYLIVSKLQKALHITPPPTVAGPTAKQAGEGVAGMAAITVAGLVMTNLLTKPMWSLAAALAGVTFGISATAGAASITALGTAETAVQSHADGGYITGPGTGRSDSVASWLSNGEYVVNASATSQHRDMLDAINNGDSRETVSTKFAPQVNASSNGSPRSQMKVEVHNYNGSRVETQQMDENTVRLIVRDEAPQLIAQYAPGAVANDIANPNSKTSKAISRNVVQSRVR